MGPAGFTVVALGAMAGAIGDARPITLVTEATGTGVTVQVVGGTEEPLQAAYTLEMSSGASGGNRSVQSGTARLGSGQRVVLLTAHLGGNAGANWKARLNVHPAGGGDYEIVEQAD